MGGDDIFSPAIRHRLDRADAWCRTRGQRLTPIRRAVLGLVLSDPRPSGAYDILERLRQLQPRAVPPTVYRALEFLLEQGLVHRIERLSAFIGCTHALDCHAGECAHSTWGHRAQFLICRRCHMVQELEQDVVAAVLLASAKSHGFRAEGATVEIEGLCATCSAGA